MKVVFYVITGLLIYCFLIIGYLYNREIILSKNLVTLQQKNLTLQDQIEDKTFQNIQARETAKLLDLTTQAYKQKDNVDKELKEAIRLQLKEITNRKITNIGIEWLGNQEDQTLIQLIQYLSQEINKNILEQEE